jgi:hypothetical protein
VTLLARSRGSCDRVGSLSDGPVVQEIVGAAQASAPPHGSRIGAAIGWPLDEWALMDRAALFVGGDSGPMRGGCDRRTHRRPVWTDDGGNVGVAARCRFATIDNGPLPCRLCDQRVCEPGDFRCLRRIEAWSSGRSPAAEWQMTSRTSTLEWAGSRRSPWLGVVRLAAGRAGVLFSAAAIVWVIVLWNDRRCPDVPAFLPLLVLRR